MLSKIYLQYLLTTIAVCFIAGWILVWFLHILAIVHGFRTLHRKREPESLLEAGGVMPGVSIIKPLVGVDQNLCQNLESFFLLDYPEFELLFCVQNDTDPALYCVNHLMEKYPLVNARLFIGGAAVGVNPKINNMHPAYVAAKYDLILVSDAGIKMMPDTLQDMVCSMRKDVALVHQMPFLVDKKGFPSVLEKVYFGTAHARIYLSADCLHFNCPTGMSALMRKNLLDEVGGFAAFGSYLAEDYFFAKSFTDRGWKIAISSQPAWQNSCTADIETFQNRLTRWAKLRIAMLPHIIFFEPLSECFALGAGVSWAVSYLFPHYDPFAVYLFHILFWFLFDYTLLKIVQRSELPFSKIDFVIAWLLRELFALVLFAKALYDPEIRWRTGTFRLKWGGYVEEIKPTKPEPLAPAVGVVGSSSGGGSNSVGSGGVAGVDEKEPKYQMIEFAL